MFLLILYLQISVFIVKTNIAVKNPFLLILINFLWAVRSGYHQRLKKSSCPAEAHVLLLTRRRRALAPLHPNLDLFDDIESNRRIKSSLQRPATHWKEDLDNSLL